MFQSWVRDMYRVRKEQQGSLLPVNRIARVCSDHCATRRYMVELGLMSRANGVYEFTETGKSAWRVERFICEGYLETV